MVVIDDDLGRSGGGIARKGFERLLVAIGNGSAGAVVARRFEWEGASIRMVAFLDCRAVIVAGSVNQDEVVSLSFLDGVTSVRFLRSRGPRRR